jgi:hypothetical protein
MEFKCSPGTNKFCCSTAVVPRENWLDSLKRKVPQAPNCGQSMQYRIMGGKQTEINEYPWTVLLEYEDCERMGESFGSSNKVEFILDDNSTEFLCGGSIINKRYVLTGELEVSDDSITQSSLPLAHPLLPSSPLTAAHCVMKKTQSKKLKRVRIGEWDINSSPDCSEEEQSFCAPPAFNNEIVSEIVHPEYVKDSRDQAHDIALLRLARFIDFNEFVQPICLPLEPEIHTMNFTGHSFDVAGEILLCSSHSVFNCVPF